MRLLVALLALAALATTAALAETTDKKGATLPVPQQSVLSYRQVSPSGGTHKTNGPLYEINQDTDADFDILRDVRSQRIHLNCRNKAALPYTVENANQGIQSPVLPRDDFATIQDALHYIPDNPNVIVGDKKQTHPYIFLLYHRHNIGGVGIANIGKESGKMNSFSDRNKLNLYREMQEKAQTWTHLGSLSQLKNHKNIILKQMLLKKRIPSNSFLLKLRPDRMKGQKVVLFPKKRVSDTEQIKKFVEKQFGSKLQQFLNTGAVSSNLLPTINYARHAIKKRSPLELGLVRGLTASAVQVTHHGTNSHTNTHHNVVVHPPKASSGLAATSHHHVVQVSSLHNVEGLVTHATIDPALHITSTTVITHDKPLIAHPADVSPTHAVIAAVAHPVVADASVAPALIADASGAHAVIAVPHALVAEDPAAHAVLDAAADHAVIAAAHAVVAAGDHPVIEHHEVAVIPLVVKHEAVGVEHPGVAKAAVLVQPHHVTTHDTFRSHVGGFGVGLDYGGHGAGHGYYVSTGFGFR